MCSVQEDDPVIERKARVEVDAVCMKCDATKAVVLVRLNDPLCKTCFLAYFTHKFRATIGKARVIRHEDKVLLAISGGPNSLAMLKLVSNGYSENVARKFRFIPSVVYIDEGAVLGMNKDERIKIINDIKTYVSENGGFPLHVAAIEDAFLDDKNQPEIAVKKLKDCFNSVTSLTAKEDLLKSLRNQLLVQVALTTGNPKVMVGDSASRISVRLLSNISQGRGEALSYDTGFLDSRHGNIIVLRPMREFVAKEISLYNFFSNIDPIHIPSLATMSGCYGSIDRLTEDFVSGLQSQLPSTVNTIFRTGDKLTEAKELSERCSLCGIPVEFTISSINKNLEHLNLDKHCNELEASSQLLCYGCNLTLKDTNQGFQILPFLGNAKKLSQSTIRDKIQGFLLDDNQPLEEN